MKKQCLFLVIISITLVLVPVLAVPQAEPEENEKEKWDVNESVLPFDEVRIDTDEGTWMSLDVSPDGKDIIFDLLGDIYRIPIEGGQAQELTDEIAWNIQPRYSPDGKVIAFTSDRGGGDNIWVMDSDGGNLRQITKEDYRLLNSPVWSPDGEYIAAHKHFTSTRSLGAGEIWLYHISGTNGVQMTKKPNDQKDLGEPAFSPDGRYLYFSQDTTPGNYFEYNKDSNKQIYIVKRLDRQTGQIENYLTGPGGSIRPTPSPDGKYIAFIRRVDYKTTLFVHEIESGAEWSLYGKLDRDNQETWAVQGVYPNIAWTPDSKYIVFWAGGKIRKIDTDTKDVVVIPFTIDTTRKVTNALRFPVELEQEKFDVKMLRWTSVSPDGKRVVFQALGHLYIRNIPNGKQKRLTRQNNDFEFHPCWSRDGKKIVYTTWNDEELGTIRIISAQGGHEGIVITSKPGHYVEPVFSPDGSKVVYRKVRPDALRTGTWARQTGIYCMPVKGGKAELVTEQGSSPHFGKDHNRVYYVKGDGNGTDRSFLLNSIELDGSDERAHFSSKNALEYRVSPNGELIAFQEGYNAYVMPFTYSGRKIEISSDCKSIPVKKVSADAGAYLHFSGNSKNLSFCLGPKLFTVDLEHIFEYSEDCDKNDLPETLETNLSFHANIDVPSGIIALVGGRIITMDGDEVINSGTVIIEGNRIKAVGAKEDVEIPHNAIRYDISGKTVMPGIIDVHAHGPYGKDGIIPQQNWASFAALAFGVTTNHDPSSHTDTIFAASEMAKAGIITAPRTFSTGTILYGADLPIKADVNSVDDALSHIRRLKSAGAFTVKSYNQPRRDQRQQVIAAANELEMMVVPEGGSLFHANMTMIIDGHTGIEHPLPLADAYNDVITLWANSGTGSTPAVIAGYGGLWGEHYWYQHTDVWKNQRLLTFVPRDIVAPRSRRRIMAPDEEYNHIKLVQICKKLIDAGGRVHLGAHGQLQGLGAHWELWMFVQGGFTPLEAIKAATIDGAKYIGLDKEIGSIEAGKFADMIVLEKNPLENIRNSEHIRYTIINGRIYDAGTIDQIGNDPVKRKKFYWEIDYSLKGK